MSSRGPRTRIPTATPWRGYAVDDPDQPGRLTAWWTDDRLAMRPWSPDGTRYAPLPPAYDSANKRERSDDLRCWYDRVYFPWLERVADAIAADLEAAAVRFRAAYPTARILPTPGAISRANRERDERRRRYESVVAAWRVRRGASVAEVARHLGSSWETARSRVQAGERLLAADREGARRFVAGYLGQVLADDSAEQLAERLLDGGRIEAARVATRQVLAEARPVARSQPADGDAWTQELRAFLAGGGSQQC